MAFPVSTEYYNLCSKTIDCYAQLQKKLEDPRVIEALKNEVIIIFGPQRIGKSTFLARMATDLEGRQFQDEMKKTDEKFEVVMKMGEIEVASGNVAVTLVPNFHIFNGQLIIDLAGCKDITENRRPIISLLNYCLLSKIPALKILTVIPLSSLLTNTIHEAVNGYYEYFCDLLTKENVPGGLRSNVFLVTMVDKYMDQFSIGKYEGMPVKSWFEYCVGRYSGTLGSRTPEVSQLSSSIQSSGILIDYANSREIILQEVMDKLKRSEAMNAKLIRLDVGGVRNEIISQCLSVTRTYISMLEDFSIQIKQLATDTESQYKVYLSFATVPANLKKMNIELSSLTKKRVSNKELIIKGQAERELLLGKLEDLSQQILEVRDQQRAFEEKYEGFSMLMLSIVTSTSRESQEKLYFEYITRQGSVRPTETLILDLDTFQNHQTEIYSCLDAESVYGLRLPTIIMDKRSSISSAANRLTLQVSSNKPFVVLLMDTVNVRETPLRPLFSANYGDRLKTLDDFVIATQAKIESMDRNLITLSTGQSDLIRDFEKIAKEFIGIKELTIKNLECVAEVSDGNNNRLDDLRSKMKHIQSDQILRVTQEIGKVLKHSNLDGDVIKEIGKNEERMISLIESLEKQRNRNQWNSMESRKFITTLSQIVSVGLDQ